MDHTSRRPELELPPDSCDSHCHVFGPTARFPYAGDRPSTPRESPLEDLETLWSRLGFRRAVIVQSAVHGTDHSALVDALRRGGGRYRGVALLTPATPDLEVSRLHEEGVRGVRLNFMNHLRSTAPARDDVAAIVRKAELHGWHVAVHVSGAGLLDYEELIRSIPVPVVIDHMARVDLSAGLDTEAIRTLKNLLELDHVWVKLSGADRLATNPPALDDSVELARSLARHAPERVVWGTDYPHPNTQFIPDDIDLVNTLSRIAPTADLLQRLLVDNPARLFDFAGAS
jgi:2-pyrone-4,6-dicarboxylate lactonase